MRTNAFTMTLSLRTQLCLLLILGWTLLLPATTWSLQKTYQSRKLAKKHARKNERTEKTATEVLLLKLAKWRESQEDVSERAENSGDALDDFLKRQGKSTDACHARMLEAKRALDLLFGKVKSLEMSVLSWSEALSTGTEDLRVSEEQIAALKEQLKVDEGKCAQLVETARAEVSQYEEELKELEQIANPTHKFDLDEDDDGGGDGETLLQLTSISRTTKQELQEEHFPKQEELRRSANKKNWMTRRQCEGFASWMERRIHRQARSGLLELEAISGIQVGAESSEVLDEGDSEEDEDGPENTAPDCESQRSELQKMFTKAYTEIKVLLQKAKGRVTDKTCLEDARGKFNMAVSPLLSQREEASRRNQEASNSLAALRAQLDLNLDGTDKLKTHIHETLKPECREAGKVSGHLQAVRDLIVSLEHCPDKHDFELKLPELPKDDEPEDDNTDDTLVSGGLGTLGIGNFGSSRPVAPHNTGWGVVKGALMRTGEDFDGTCLAAQTSRKIRIKSEKPDEKECRQWEITQNEDWLWGKTGEEAEAAHGFQIKDTETGWCLDWNTRRYTARQCYGGLGQAWQRMSRNRYCIPCDERANPGCHDPHPCVEVLDN